MIDKMTTSKSAIRSPDLGFPKAQGLDAQRQLLVSALETSGITMKQASRALGRNDAYLQQFIYRGSPRRLPESNRHQLATLLGIDHTALLANGDPARRGDGGSARNITTEVPFYHVNASAGGGAFVDQTTSDGAASGTSNDPNSHFSFPTAFIRGITSSIKSELRMITISGDSMAPVLEHGDLVMIDCAKTHPSPPGIFILDDGVGLVAKRLEQIPNSPMIRIISENAVYTNYRRHIDEVHIIGRVVWFARTL